MLMLIPDKSALIWRQLIMGEREYRFKLVPASMMLSRLIRSVQSDNSEANIQRCIDELHHFFNHYHVVLSKDIQILFGSQTEHSPVATTTSASLLQQRNFSSHAPLR
ncbi:hypothetical protein [Thioflexithrix psekupsensis]|uniref:Uncharacterized protein n=1 Tax=Thioflexithrix psekupsensis TaxID=1570016 RepID=A0A251X915_9GAMM|nr:hypothetical protein [Thioflexithrix psekupsensis]OUD14163.1 hypothetical protein TPSD3_07470 [Thioflexithrix psekupsensis]